MLFMIKAAVVTAVFAILVGAAYTGFVRVRDFFRKADGEDQ